MSGYRFVAVAMIDKSPTADGSFPGISFYYQQQGAEPEQGIGALYGYAVPMIQDAGPTDLGFAWNPVSGQVNNSTPFDSNFSVTNSFTLFDNDSQVDQNSVTDYPACNGASTCAFSFKMPSNYPNSQYVDPIYHGHTYSLQVTAAANETNENTLYLANFIIHWPTVP